jgi:hypothetical protein
MATVMVHRMWTDGGLIVPLSRLSRGTSDKCPVLSCPSILSRGSYE